MPNSHLEWTGERFLPELGGTIALEHIHRYLLARELAKDKDVLDIACGEGYGSAMLAEVANHISGVDISTEAVAHATEKYYKDNLQFLVGSCAAIPLPDDSIDLVVSFETIEHHDQHQEMMQEIKRVLRPDGLLLISSPDKHEFTDIGQQGTHYHVRELYRSEFEELLGAFFENVEYSGQRIIYGSGIFGEQTKKQTISFHIDNIEKGFSPGIHRPLYLIAIASNSILPDAFSAFLEENIEKSQYVQSLLSNYSNLENGYQKQLHAIDEKLHERSLEVIVRDNNLASINRELAGRDRLLQEKDQLLHQSNLELREKDQLLHQSNLELREKDQLLHQSNLELQEKDQLLHQSNLELQEKDQLLHQSNLELQEKDQLLHQSNLELQEKDQLLTKNDKRRSGEYLTCFTDYVCQLFIDSGSGFNEEESMTAPLLIEQNEIVFNIKEFNSSKILNLRIDPINTKAVVEIKCLELVSRDHRVSVNASELYGNTVFVDNNIFCFHDDDPQIYFDGLGEHADIDEVRINLEFSGINNEVYSLTNSFFKQEIAKQKCKIEELEFKLKNHGTN